MTKAEHSNILQRWGGFWNPCSKIPFLIVMQSRISRTQCPYRISNVLVLPQYTSFPFCLKIKTKCFWMSPNHILIWYHLFPRPLLPFCVLVLTSYALIFIVPCFGFSTAPFTLIVPINYHALPPLPLTIQTSFFTSDFFLCLRPFHVASSRLGQCFSLSWVLWCTNFLYSTTYLSLLLFIIHRVDLSYSSQVSQS